MGSTDFDSFFRKHFPPVARAAALVARDGGTGQDMAQEAFVRLHPRWTSMSSEEHARNFVYRVAINLARSHVRKHVRLRLVGLLGQEEPDTRSDPLTRTTEWLSIVGALNELSARQRACLVLVDYADLEPAVVGRILGIRPETVRVHLMRGRRALRQRLGSGQREEQP